MDKEQIEEASPDGKKAVNEKSSPSEGMLDVVNSLDKKGDPSWSIATEIVKKVKPVPWTFWVLIRAVWGGVDKGKVVIDSTHFSVVDQLVLRAAQDEELAILNTQKKNQLGGAFNALGPHTIASLCFVHAVCKRVAGLLPERVYKAIIDDALLRARLGVILSKFSPKVSVGAGLLVGFSGRAGLAVQLASGTGEQAADALRSLAKGSDISSTGRSVYGCDPLQVGALSLISGGCSQQMATGISTFGNKESVVIGTQQYDWMMYFDFIEQMRVGKLDNVSEADCSYLAISLNDIEDMQQCAKQAFRMGHDFEWLLLNLSEMYTEDGPK